MGCEAIEPWSRPPSPDEERRVTQRSAGWREGHWFLWFVLVDEA